MNDIIGNHVVIETECNDDGVMTTLHLRFHFTSRVMKMAKLYLYDFDMLDRQGLRLHIKPIFVGTYLPADIIPSCLYSQATDTFIVPCKEAKVLLDLCNIGESTSTLTYHGNVDIKRVSWFLNACVNDTESVKEVVEHHRTPLLERLDCLNALL